MQCYLYNNKNGYFLLFSGGVKIPLWFTARRFSEIPSELIFAQSVLKRMRLSSLVCGIVCINKQVTYITNQVLTSKHDCVWYVSYWFTFTYESTKLYVVYTKLFKTSFMRLFSTCTLYCTKKTHRVRARENFG